MSTTLANRIVDLMAEKVFVGEPVDLDVQFSDLDLDSLVMVELSVIIERRFGVRLSEEELLSAGTVREVVARVETASKASV